MGSVPAASGASMVWLPASSSEFEPPGASSPQATTKPTLKATLIAFNPKRLDKPKQELEFHFITSLNLAVRKANKRRLPTPLPRHVTAAVGTSDGNSGAVTDRRSVFEELLELSVKPRARDLALPMKRVISNAVSHNGATRVRR